MNKQQFIRGLDHIDADLVDSYIIKRQQLQTASARRRAAVLRYGAMAACLCIMLTAFIAIPLMSGRDTPPDVLPGVDTPADTTTQFPAQTTAPPPVEVDPNAPPAVSFVESSLKLTGSTGAVVGSVTPEQTGNSDSFVAALQECFYVQTVVEAKVTEILPHVYLDPIKDKTYHVIKLHITDVVRGEGHPEEIYFRYYGYDEHLFEGHDTFLFSLYQIGFENYATVNATEGKVELFPNMYKVCGYDDPTYGSVIAFTGGVLDTSFWEKISPEIDTFPEYYRNCLQVEHDTLPSNDYPARLGESIEQAKARVLENLSKNITHYFEISLSNPDYISEEDIFTTDELKEIQSYVAPTEKSVFIYTFGSHYARKTATVSYQRLINGFVVSQQTIIIEGRLDVGMNAKHVAGHHFDTYTEFTENDLSHVPNIGEAIAAIDLDALTPPHINPDSTATLTGCEITGKYKKVGDKVYGIIMVEWLYTLAEPHTYLRDDLYYLYDSDGNASMVERDELESIIGKDSIINSFSYEPFWVWVDY